MEKYENAEFIVCEPESAVSHSLKKFHYNHYAHFG